MSIIDDIRNEGLNNVFPDAILMSQATLDECILNDRPFGQPVIRHQGGKGWTFIGTPIYIRDDRKGFAFIAFRDPINEPIDTPTGYAIVYESEPQ
jgi:hypothetical protein